MQIGAEEGSRIVISVEDQELRLVAPDGEEAVRYPISTSKFGLGPEEGSYKTPLGEFAVKEKIGDDAELRTIFRSREEEGLWDGEATDEDLVLTRILRLEGKEEENANTYDRYIYIHGTNQEEAIGTPMSWGCIRMKNEDVVDLYDRVPEGVPVTIRESKVEEA